MANPFLAYIRGLPETPSVTEINVRSGPNKTYELVLKSPVGTSQLPILEVKADDRGDNFQGKVYTWFRLQFPDGKAGWARDDLLEISGDGTAFGYGNIAVRTFAFTLSRQTVSTTASVLPTAAPVTPVMVAAPAPAPAVTLTEAAPVAVTPAPAPVPSPAPVSPVVAVPAVSTGGTPIAIIKTQGAANTRFGPGSNFERTGMTLERHGRFPILAVQREAAGQNYRWLKLDAKSKQLWIREDLVTYEGDTAFLGLPTDLYPAPMKDKYWWVRGYNLPPNKDAGLVEHDGWDLGAVTGEPLYCGPNGGLVVKSFQCSKCTPDRPSTLMNGYSLGDPSIFSDPGWGNGYGNYVIVRYTHQQQPQSTRDLLASQGFGGGAIFVMYAHLETRLVEGGQALVPGQQIGTCGNTGNSEATHLHLEIRASKNPDFIHWASIRSGVMDAVALFKR